MAAPLSSAAALRCRKVSGQSSQSAAPKARKEKFDRICRDSRPFGLKATDMPLFLTVAPAGEGKDFHFRHCCAPEARRRKKLTITRWPLPRSSFHAKLPRSSATTWTTWALQVCNTPSQYLLIRRGSCNRSQGYLGRRRYDGTVIN